MAAVVVVLKGDAEIDRWPLASLEPPDLAVVDYLARLQLAAGRRGCRIRVCRAPTALAELLRLAGLARSVTATGCGLVVEVGPEPATGCSPVVEATGEPATGEPATGCVLAVEVCREPEGGKQARVEEGVEGRDPLA